MQSFGNPEVSTSNLGISFFGCLGKLCNKTGIAKESFTNQGWLFPVWLSPS